MIIEQRVLPNVRLGDDVRIWESSNVYEVLYLVFMVQTIVDFLARFLMEVKILIEVPSKRFGIRHRCGI